MRSRILVGLLVILLLPLASAFSITFIAVNNSILPDQAASYAITVINTKGFEDTFQVSTRDPSWILTTDPPLSSVPSLTTKTFMLFIKPKQTVETGPHAVPIKTKSLRSGQFREDNLLINIKPTTPFGGEYAPSIKVDVVLDSVVDVRENLPLKIAMTNKNPRDMPELRLIINSDAFYREIEMSLSPLETKVQDLIFTPIPTTKPGIHTVAVKLILENITIAEVAKDYEVLAYKNLVEKVEPDSHWFVTTKVYTITNMGNLLSDGVKQMKIPFYKKIFVSFDKAPQKVEVDGKKLYEWKQTLEPSESMQLVAVHNYRTLVLILFSLILATIAYYAFRSPLVVIKQAFVHDGDHMKVRLQVKNRSKKQLTNVKIQDKVPNMAEVLKKVDHGTLKPNKIAKGAKGTSIRWEIEFLDPHEERIISYNMHSKLKLVGGMSLPPARVKFENVKGKERISYSNSAAVVDRD